MKATVEDVVAAVKSGVYPGRFDAIEEKTNEQGKYWLWTFTLAVPEASIGDTEQFSVDPDTTTALIPITGTTSPRITPRTKAAKWIEALQHREVVVDDEIDFDALLGKVAQVVIEIADTGYSRIHSLLPEPQG
jgi:hypothetical protein